MCINILHSICFHFKIIFLENVNSNYYDLFLSLKITKAIPQMLLKLLEKTSYLNNNIQKILTYVQNM